MKTKCAVCNKRSEWLLIPVQPATDFVVGCVVYNFCRVCHVTLIDWQLEGGTERRSKDPINPKQDVVQRLTVHDFVRQGGPPRFEVAL